ncbi:MAG: hypothetical protein M3Y65_10545 [Pseudomonadota bacterium]|nr:hypothetical protein [Pseudomonadota bacterium]
MANNHATSTGTDARADDAPFVLVHTNLGLTDYDTAWTFLKGPGGKKYRLDGVEHVLLNIDLVQEPDRTKLLASAAEHYGLPYAAMMGQPEQIAAGAVAVSGGAQ